MSDTDEPKPETAELETPEAANGNGDGAPAEAVPEPPPPPAAPPTVEEQLAAAKEDTRAMREKMLRVAADYENFRKRSSREVDDARLRGRESAVKDLLPVFDNFERATSQVDEASDPASVMQGLLMVQKQFLDVLGKMGIERVPTVGQGFNPSMHESIQYAHSAEHPAGTVMSELQGGYKQRGMLIRPALVVVSRGPEEATQPAPPDEPAEPTPVEGEPEEKS